MADKYQNLLIEWCDALVRAQITDKKDERYGGFACESCGFCHGRADNAVYPLVCAYAFTGKKRYLFAAERLLVFRKKLTQPSGAVQNDFSSAWEGITAFSVIGLIKTLLYFGDKLPLSFKRKIETCARRSAQWVHRTMVVGFPAYINYYCAASLVNALYDRYFHDDAYRAQAKALIDYCMGLFTPNGLLAGEGKPHDDRSPKGCLPIDIGYVVEESMPCLIHAATLLGDQKTQDALRGHATAQLRFMLPDGGWDNSFGVRNNKWTYYGSRTSDGCIGAFAYLAKNDPLFGVAADRTYRLLRSCTSNGLLYGGPHYRENGQNPCVHHTFCHAASLADALHEGIKEPVKKLSLPLEEQEAGYLYYPELNVWLIRVGAYRATLSGYDYATHHYANGAAHASGGTLSLLYKDGAGAVIAGSVYEYLQTEPNNMQAPLGGKKHATLLPRAEYQKDGVKYATCLDRDAQITVECKEGVVTAKVKARFFAAGTQTAEKSDLFADFTYRFASDGVTIKVGKVDPSVRFVLPVVEGSAEVIADRAFVKQPIFFLTGGFSAEEYAFSLKEDLTIKIV